MCEPPQHAANPVEHRVDRGEFGRGDVAACACDTQRGGELAGRAGSATEQVDAIEASALPCLADIECDGLGGTADLVGERLAALADFGLHRSELLQHGERHLERIEHWTSL